MRTFKLNMIPSGIPLYIPCNQFERGDYWKFQLYYNGARYIIPEGAEIRITGTKSDGNSYERTLTAENNEVLVEVTEQMTAAKGRSVVEFLVIDGDVVLYSANFIVDVEFAAIQGELVDSDIPDTIVTADGDVYIRIDLQLDATLTEPLKPAQAKAVGDAIQAARTAATNAVNQLREDLSDAVHSEEVSSIVKIMRADYDALPVKQPDTLYIVQDD